MEIDTILKITYFSLILFSLPLYFVGAFLVAKRKHIKTDKQSFWFFILFFSIGIALLFLIIEQIFLDLHFPIEQFPIGPHPEINNYQIAQLARIIVSLAVLFSALAILASNIFVIYYFESKYTKIIYVIAFWEFIYSLLYFILPYLWVRKPEIWEYSHPGFNNVILFLFLVPVYATVSFYLLLIYKMKTKKEDYYNKKLLNFNRVLILTIAYIFLAAGYTIQILSPNVISAFLIFIYPILTYKTFTQPFTLEKLKNTVDLLLDRPLTESTEIFRILAEQSFLGIAIIQNQKIMYANSKVSEIIGYAVEEILKWKQDEFIRRIHPDDLDFVFDQIQKKSQGETSGIVPHYSCRLITKNYEIKWIEIYSKTIIFRGKTADFITLNDITEEKTIQEKYQRLVEGSEVGILTFNKKDGKIIFNNSKAASIFDYKIGEFKSQSFYDFIFEEDTTSVIENLQYPNKQILDLEFRGIKKDNTLIWIKMKFSNPININDSIQYQCYLWDISKEKELQELQEQFIATTSHELRTPVTVIKGYIEYLENIPEFLDNKLFQSIHQSLNRNLERLSQSLNAIHDLSFIRSGTFTLNRDYVNFAEFITFIQRDLSILYPTKDIKFQMNVSEDLQSSMYFDEDRMNQVIFNLLSNAAKNSPDETPVILSFNSIEKTHLQIIVQDYGSGISPEAEKHLFEPFSHVDSQYSTRGTGLGLYISKVIIDLHNGSIKINSRENYGTTIIITIPIKKELNKKNYSPSQIE